jgi:hypothetical protein
MAFCIYRRLGKESQETQAVINGNDNHFFAYEQLGIVRGAAAINESSSMNPKHHRQAAPIAITPSMIRLHLWGEDIQEKAILAAPSSLRTLTSELSCLQEKSWK